MTTNTLRLECESPDPDLAGTMTVRTALAEVTGGTEVSVEYEGSNRPDREIPMNPHEDVAQLQQAGRLYQAVVVLHKTVWYVAQPSIVRALHATGSELRWIVDATACRRQRDPNGRGTLGVSRQPAHEQTGRARTAVGRAGPMPGRLGGKQAE